MQRALSSAILAMELELAAAKNEIAVLQEENEQLRDFNAMLQQTMIGS
jgi:hypothetical protein